MAILLGTLNADQIYGTSAADLITALNGNDLIVGNDGADIIDGGAGNDVIYAGSKTSWGDGAIDTVLGGLGDDHIYGGYGDALDGGLGFDTLSLDLSGATSGVTIDFRPMTIGVDLGLGGLTRITIPLATVQLGNFEAVDHVIGSDFADTISAANADGSGTILEGGGGSDDLTTGAGNDRLDGGTGADHLTGGKGDDTYIVDNVGDVISENVNGGFDRVISSVSYTLSGNVEQLTLTGDAVEGRGDARDNTIVGTAGDNSLYGLDGRDTLNGAGGDDTIYGGKSRDTLTGGSGADTFVFRDNEAEVVDGAPRKLADLITDFSHADGDKISLGAIDAVVGTAANDKFTFIGEDRFSGTAGELRFVHVGTETFVFGDTDGDKVDDFRIQLHGTLDLVAADFQL